MGKKIEFLPSPSAPLLELHSALSLSHPFLATKFVRTAKAFRSAANKVPTSPPYPARSCVGTRARALVAVAVAAASAGERLNAKAVLSD